MNNESLINKIKDVLPDIKEINESLNELFKNKKVLNQQFSGRDRDLLRVVRSSFKNISKQEKEISNIQINTDSLEKDKSTKQPAKSKKSKNIGKYVTSDNYLVYAHRGIGSDYHGIEIYNKATGNSEEFIFTNNTKPGLALAFVSNLPDNMTKNEVIDLLKCNTDIDFADYVKPAEDVSYNFEIRLFKDEPFEDEEVYKEWEHHFEYLYGDNPGEYWGIEVQLDEYGNPPYVSVKGNISGVTDDNEFVNYIRESGNMEDYGFSDIDLGIWEENKDDNENDTEDDDIEVKARQMENAMWDAAVHQDYVYVEVDYPYAMVKFDVFNGASRDDARRFPDNLDPDEYEVEQTSTGAGTSPVAYDVRKINE